MVSCALLSLVEWLRYVFPTDLVLLHHSSIPILLSLYSRRCSGVLLARPFAQTCCHMNALVSCLPFLLPLLSNTRCLFLALCCQSTCGPHVLSSLDHVAAESVIEWLLTFRMITIRGPHWARFRRQEDESSSKFSKGVVLRRVKSRHSTT